jgi:solute carrier family 35 protein F1/2
MMVIMSMICIFTGSNPFLGDLLCICGTLFYAISNVAQEYLVKNHSVLEWLGFIGFVGAFVSGIQLCIIDRHTLALIEWEYYSALVLVGFVIALVLFYILMPLVIRISSAAVINLSLLTADIFTFLFGVYLFKFSFSLLYVLSLVIIVVGIFIFNLKSPPVATPSTRLSKFREKLSHLRLPNSKNKMANGKEMNVKSTPNKSSQTNKEERSHILVRGPVEAALSSNTYSTHYSQSMSYGSNDNNNGTAQDKQH